jgi:hypothetical protein
MSLTPANLNRAFRRGNKYFNKRVTVDGIPFDSKAEAARFGELMLLHKAKAICGLVVHKSYPLEVNGTTIGKYEADFVYLRDGELVVEDVKAANGHETALFKWKRRHMKAQYNIDVKVVK